MHMPSPLFAIDPPPAGARPGDRGGLSITTTTITVTTRPVRPVVFA
jgi:hypothetical protein